MVIPIPPRRGEAFLNLLAILTLISLCFVWS